MEPLEAKLDRSVGQLGTKLERLRPQLNNLNGKVVRLIGRIFGVGTQIEEDMSKRIRWRSNRDDNLPGIQGAVCSGGFEVEVDENGRDGAGGFCAELVCCKAESMPYTEDEVTARIHCYADPTK